MPGRTWQPGAWLTSLQSGRGRMLPPHRHDLEADVVVAAIRPGPESGGSAARLHDSRQSTVAAGPDRRPWGFQRLPDTHTPGLPRASNIHTPRGGFQRLPEASRHPDSEASRRLPDTQTPSDWRQLEFPSPNGGCLATFHVPNSANAPTPILHDSIGTIDQTLPFTQHGSATGGRLGHRSFEPSRIGRQPWKPIVTVVVEV
jgi:hypothetical protein